MANILIVEDEKNMQDIIAAYMTKGGHTCFVADDGVEALLALKNNPMDFMILDLMLPHLDGFSVCRVAREMGNMPILMLTAKSEEADKLKGYEYGADDYMTKPFAIEELLARIRLVLKKRGGAPSADKNQLGIGKLCMDVQRYEVSYDGQQVELTHREFELLRVLLENKNIVISRDTLLEKVCGYDYMGETNIIDVYVRYLRSKIDDVYQVKIIQTVRGVGYCIKDE